MNVLNNEYLKRIYAFNNECFYNKTKPFDVCLMNPPYDDTNQFIDMQFVEKINKLANYQIVIHPAKRWCSETKIGKQNAESGHLKELEIVNSNEIFNINAKYKYGGIFYYDNKNKYDTYDVIFNGNTTSIKYDDFKQRNEFLKTIDISNEIKTIIKSKESLYKELLNKYNTMVNDGHGFVYEEPDLKRGKRRYNIVKNDSVGLSEKRRDYYRQMLKDGKYKYCLYKGSFNNDYDEVQEWHGQDPFKFFNGHILWLTNSATVRDNIRYWLECPLCDMWRKYRFELLSRNMTAGGCNYGEIPAFDFEMDTDKFRKEVDKLNDFTPDEIREMKKYNIHNIDKYDTKY